jgi:hypothetical protein
MSNTPEKKKKSLQAFKSEIHAIVPMDIEVIHRRLHQIKDKQIEVSTRRTSSETVAFIIQHRSGSRVNSEISGTLRRWQGTQTRLDADSRSYVPGEWINYVVYIICVLCLTWVFTIVMQGFLTLFVGISQWFMSLALSLVGAVALMHYSITVDLFREKHYQAAKDIDHLFQELADTLTGALPDELRLLEFDGSEDALARLLKHETQTNIQVGSDGELR